MIIRLENKKDYQEVEKLTRNAFWNVYKPGCDEHYLVHIMRHHEDFVKELAFVIEENEKIIANIMYTKAKLIDENGNIKTILSFGPLSVSAEYQKKSYAKILIEHSLNEALRLGYDAVVIFGNPEYYLKRGFISSKKLNISLEEETYPLAMLARELKENTLDNKKWTYYPSSVFEIAIEDVENFDKNFEHLEKSKTISQELFKLYEAAIIL